jgi:predicted permease
MAFLGDPARLLRRVFARLRRSSLDDELRQEMAQHLALRRQQLIDDGMDPRDAAFEARRMFGNALVLREEARRTWSLGALDTIAQDVRFALRLLGRTPLFTATVVLSLALGIGAAAAVFQLADAVLFRPLPVRAPQALWSFSAVQRIGAATKEVGGVDDETFARMAQQEAFAPFVGSRPFDEVSIDGGGVPATVRAEAVSSNYFDTLGVRFIRGTRGPDPQSSGGLLPVVLSERISRAIFPSDSQVIGRVITINDKKAVVYGIVGPFRGVSADRPADVFLRLADSAAVSNGSDSQIRLVLRLPAGTPIAEAEQRMAALFRETSGRVIPGARVEVQLVSARHGISDTRAALERPLVLGLVLVGVLLLVASTNAGGLMLARLASRRGELAVRMAIGAGRARLVRQLTVEALVIAAAAAVLGLFAGSIVGPLLSRSIPSSVPIDYDLRLDGRLFAFTAAASLAAALMAVTASIFRLRQSDITTLLAGESRTVVAGNRRTTNVLVGAQVACTMLLLLGAAALTRTLINLRSVPLGFTTDAVFAVDVDGTGRADARGGPTAYFSALLNEASSAPFVASATLAQFRLMVHAATTGTLTTGGFTPGSDEDRWVRMYFVGPRYFETVGMPLLLGRDVQAADQAGRERVAIVNETLAKFYFKTADEAIGRIVNKDVRIVGVVADARYDTLRDEPARVMFIPYTQAPTRTRMSLLVRSSGDRAAAIGSVLERLRRVDPELRAHVTTGDAWISAAVARERFVASIALALSVLALFLACAGLYAAVAAATAQRRGEIAVRMALGASRSSIFTFVLRDPLRTTLAGVTAGIPGAIVLIRLAQSLLFGVGVVDVPALVLCTILVVAVALAAAIVPARRAAGIDPAVALRVDA